MKHTTKQVVVSVILLLVCHAATAQYVIHIAGSDRIDSASIALWGINGPAANATFATPFSMCRDAVGNLYMSDLNSTLVRKINAATGIITTIAGGGTALGHNVPATTASINPNGICLDHAGNLYIADFNRSCVRKVDLSTGMIYVIAGSQAGSVGYSGDGGPAVNALLIGPVGVAADAANNVYISDGNHVIRKVDAANGTISTIAGNGTAGYGGDGGQATAASLNNPEGMYVDNNGGNLYIADLYNNRIRKLALGTGIISTVAGIGPSGVGVSGSFSGDGGPATAAGLNNPYDVVLDNAGNMFISDFYNGRIRKVAATGVISTYAGEGSRGGTVWNGVATATPITPIGMCLDSCGDLYFVDADFGIRAVVPAIPAGKMICGYYEVEQVQQTEAAIAQTELFPNPNNGEFSLQIPGAINEQVQVYVTDMGGREMKAFVIPANKTTDVRITVPSGMYMVTAITEQGAWRQKMVTGL